MPSNLKSIITRRHAGSTRVDDTETPESLSVVEPASGEAAAGANSVFLTGTLAEPGEERELAGGVHVVRWTLRVARGEGRTGTDLIDCVALDAPLQERALCWMPGSVLAVEGALRRRFFRSGGRTATRVEVEAHRVDEVAGPPGEPGAE